MPVIPVTNANIQLMLQNDCQQWRTTIQWAKARYQAYNQNCNAAAMTAAGYSTADQNTIIAFIGDLNRFIQLTNNTIPTSSSDMVYDVQAVLGIF